MYKKLLSAATALLIIASSGAYVSGAQYRTSPMTASAETDEDGQEYTVGTYGSLTYHKYVNRVIITGCDDSEEIVDIPAVIENRAVREIGYGAFAGCENIKEVTLSVNVMVIQPNAFYGCTNLREINIGSGLAGIEDTAFYGCSSLTSVTIPKNVIRIVADAFSNCTSLTEITILNPDCEIVDSPDAVSTYSGVIRGYENSTAQEFAEKYGYTFESLGEAPTKPWDSYTEGTYEGLTYLKYSDHIAIYGYDESSEKVEIPSEIEGLPVTRISGDGFYGCENVKEVIIPDTVTEINSYAFYHSGLTSITIPANVFKLGNRAFADCESLTEITILYPVCILDGFNDLISNGRNENNKIYFSGVIRGYDNSSAQYYAEEYGYTFESLGKAPTILGDVDGDVKINSADASLVLAEYALLQTGADSTFTDEQFTAADVNKDGRIDSSDASKILEYYSVSFTGGLPSWD